ncbi:MAG: class I SAM-dependent methyltransferase [Acidobacteria bacterium]|nr:class I SAM-dependent methyltransferase [Acidobacteriota bacterium]
MNAPRQIHWNNIYATKLVNGVSWYQDIPEKSLQLIHQFMPVERQPAVIDVGGGASRLVDALWAEGYRSLAVLDIAETALAKSQARLGSASEHIAWLVADVTDTKLPNDAYDLWHDRAVFHFLVEPEERSRYVQLLRQALKPGGVLVMSTFAPDGPEKCSNLTVRRYDCDEVGRILGPTFKLLLSDREIHQTPFQTQQAFSYCVFQKL